MATKSMTSIARQERIRREVLSKSEMIPSLPEVVTEVLRLVNDENSEIEDFEQPLSQDASLVARMLKLCNSSFYGVGRPVTSIKEGVQILGFRSLHSLVLASSTANFLEREFRGYGYRNKGLWLHSVAVAAVAREVSRELDFGPKVREEMFVIGLLHDIGKMLLCPYLDETGTTLEGLNEDLVAAERRIMGIDHQEAGQLIVAKWKLSPMVQYVLGNHHNTDCEGEYLRALSVVRVADHLAMEHGAGRDGPASPDLERLAADLRSLGLSSERLTELRAGWMESVDQALEAMGEIGG